MTSASGSGPRERAQIRRETIERLVITRGVANVAALAHQWAVSPSTIRRDLALLTDQGKLARTYGGAMPAVRAGEPSLTERSGLAVTQKQRIAQWAADQVSDGQTLILDAGTTTGQLASCLTARTNLTVITNGLTAIDELATADGIDVVVLAGTLRQISQGFVGPLTELTLSRLSADRAFLGADGLRPDRGICEASLAQTRVKELMVARSREVFVLADHSKLGYAPFTAWAPLEIPWTLVTDGDATDAQLAPFRAADHVTVVVV